MTKIEAWAKITRTQLHPDQPWEAHLQAYEEIFQEKPQLPLLPLWYPEAFIDIRTTHLYQIYEDLRHQNVLPEASEPPSMYAVLHRWSVQQRQAFWKYMITHRLRVPFDRPPDSWLAFPRGDISQPAWLLGARWNVIELILRQPEERLALIYERENGETLTWTYGQLKQEIQRIAGALRAQGIQEGHRIAICMPLRPEAVFLYLGAIYAGASSATIPDSLSGEEIAARLRVASPSLLFIQDGLYREGKFIPLYERLSSYAIPRTFLIAGGDTIRARLRNNTFTWEHFLSQESPLGAPSLGASDREIGVLFSSGTTAEPKAIPWSQLTALKAITDAHLYHDVRPEDRIAWPTNLGWMMGPWLLFAGLAHGACVAIYEGAPTGKGFCQFVANQKVSILGVVPSLVRRWIESQSWDGVSWESIRLFSSTGEASNPWHMWKLMAKAGYKPIIEYCGGTEIGGGYITSTLLHPNAPSQFSAPALGLDFVLLDEGGKPAEEGELFLVPPSIGLSQTLLNANHEAVYYEGTPTVREGWTGALGTPIPREYQGLPMRLRRHGDYMRRLPSGRWVSGGRADDAMNLGGIKVSSAEIERVVAQVSGVGEAAAIAVPPPEGGPERLVIYLVPQYEAPQEPSYWKPLLAQAIRERLSPLFHLHDVVVVSELPRTASNKVMRRLLRKAYLSS